MNRYLLLLGVTLAAGLALTLAARMPQSPAARPGAVAPVPGVALRIEFEDGSVLPATAVVPANHRVQLTLVNRGGAAIDVRLAGYEDRVAPGALAAGATWTGTFLADRPGEAFAWLVDGQPCGRLAVSGSHLVEGHR